MEQWAMDCSGLRAAHERGALSRLGPSHRLHVSPLTWRPAGTPGSRIRPRIQPPIRLVDQPLWNDPDIGPVPTPTELLCAELEQLVESGVLVTIDDHDCDPTHIGAIERSWEPAGLLARPTDETIVAVASSHRLDVPL